MARARTGSLEHRTGKGWFLRVTVDTVKDGKPHQERRWIPLETEDKVIAERKRKKIVAELASGAVVAEAREEAVKTLTVAEESVIYTDLRIAQGKKLVHAERGIFSNHINPVIGHMLPGDVRPADIRRVLDGVVGKGKQLGTVSHVRRLLNRFFFRFFEAEQIAENPVARTRTPDAPHDRRKRVTLTNEEIARFMASPEGDLEVKMLGLVSRTEGGMRTCELMRWTWQDIDRETFAECWIPRAKGGDAQQLDIPDVLRPFLRAWWEGHGKPSAGPVFPVRFGDRKGQHRHDGASFASRLRRDLRRAGITRREIFEDTERTKRADFHSFRRAFVSAAARGNLNAQSAMHLAGHNEIRTHLRYAVENIREIPAAILPSFDPASMPVLAQTVDDWREAITGGQQNRGDDGRFGGRAIRPGYRPSQRAGESLAKEAVCTASEDAGQGARFTGRNDESPYVPIDLGDDDGCPQPPVWAWLQ